MPSIPGARRGGNCAQQDLDRVTCHMARSGRDDRGSMVGQRVFEPAGVATRIPRMQMVSVIANRAESSTAS